MEMEFDLHVACKTCGDRLALVTAPRGHEGHLHFRCRCMPEDGMLCVLMRPHQAQAVSA